MLAYITGTVDQELLLRNEYLVAENRILKAQLKGRLRLSDGERANLGEIGHRLGRKALGEVATVALPDTILVIAHVPTVGSGLPLSVSLMALITPTPRRRAVSMTDRTLA